MSLFRSEVVYLGPLAEGQLSTGGHFTIADNITLLNGTNLVINPNAQATYLITDASAGAFTIAAPSLGNVGSATPGIPADGKVIQFVSTTAAAHTVTFPAGVLKAGAGATTVATFTADAGAGFKILAYQGTFLVLYANNVTFA
jgi:hypothetical protein